MTIGKWQLPVGDVYVYQLQHAPPLLLLILLAQIFLKSGTCAGKNSLKSAGYSAVKPKGLKLGDVTHGRDVKPYVQKYMEGGRLRRGKVRVYTWRS